MTPDQLPNVPPPTVTPQQLPDAPKQGDSYPDPRPHNGSQLPSGDGTVDPVDPRMLPSEDGAVAPVDPRMLPAGDGTVGPLDPRMLPADEFGHGGNPTTIWEENGGGVTPTTLGRRATRATQRTIGGRGLIGESLRSVPTPSHTESPQARGCFDAVQALAVRRSGHELTATRRLWASPAWASVPSPTPPSRPAPDAPSAQSPYRLHRRHFSWCRGCR